MVSAGFDPRQDGYEAARSAAVFRERSDRGWIVVRGGDRASYLHGLLTNDVASLKAGEGCYSAYLTPQGRMIADFWVYELGDAILLSMSRDVKDSVLAKLDQLVFTEDVQLGDLTAVSTGIAVLGPDAASVAGEVTGVPDDRLALLPEHGNLRGSFEGEPVVVLRTTDLGEPGFDLLVDASRAPAAGEALRAAGALEIGEEIVEVLRIEAGVPKFHRDMDEETIPLEAGIEPRAISFTKGCYVGQEVIVRVLHRGHGRVARKLIGLSLEGEAVPPPGALVRVEGREVGRITSSAGSRALGAPIALAYLQRDFVAAGTRVTVEGTAGVVTELPFVERRV